MEQAFTWASSHRVPSGASKMISEPKICLAQTMYLSCTDTNIVSKQTQMRFHMTHVTKELHFRAYVTFDANHEPILRQD